MIEQEYRNIYANILKRSYITLSIVILLFHNGSFLSAQVEAVDSLDRVLHLSMQDDQRIKTLNRMAFEFRESDPSRSRELVDVTLLKAKESGNNEELAFAHTISGFLYNNLYEYSLSLNDYLEALSLYQKMGNDTEIALLHYNIGSIYKTVGSYEKAIENCLAGLKIYERLEDKNGTALIYRVMGSIYKYKGDFEKSLTYYFDGLRINEEIGNIQGQANAFNNIGIVYLQMNDFEKALGYYRNSLALNRAGGNESEASRNIGNIGMAYLNMNQLDSAYYYIIMRIESARELNDKRGLAITLESLGDYYFIIKDYSNSERYYNEALLLSRQIGTPEISKNVLLSLSNLFGLTSDTGKAYAYYKSHINVRDSLLNMETLQRIEQMEMEYNYDKEMDKHYLLEQKIRLIRIAVFGMLLFFIMLMILIYNNQNIKLRKKILEQKSLEMDKQQLQYHVHFQNKELVSKAIHLAEQNEFIDAITVHLEEILSDPKGASISLKDVISDLKFHSDITAWKEFEYTFLQVHPDFFTSLAKRFPELTPNERRLSAFLRLNLSTKDISNITHQSLHSLVVARTRLRRKLGITNTGDNLATFLSQL